MFFQFCVSLFNRVLIIKKPILRCVWYTLDCAQSQHYSSSIGRAIRLNWRGMELDVFECWDHSKKQLPNEKQIDGCSHPLSRKTKACVFLMLFTLHAGFPASSITSTLAIFPPSPNLHKLRKIKTIHFGVTIWVYFK